MPRMEGSECEWEAEVDLFEGRQEKEKRRESVRVSRQERERLLYANIDGIGIGHWALGIGHRAVNGKHKGTNTKHKSGQGRGTMHRIASYSIAFFFFFCPT